MLALGLDLIIDLPHELVGLGIEQQVALLEAVQDDFDIVNDEVDPIGLLARLAQGVRRDARRRLKGLAGPLDAVRRALTQRRQGFVLYGDCTSSPAARCRRERGAVRGGPGLSGSFLDSFFVSGQVPFLFWIRRLWCGWPACRPCLERRASRSCAPGPARFASSDVRPKRLPLANSPTTGALPQTSRELPNSTAGVRGGRRAGLAHLCWHDLEQPAQT